VQADLSLFLLIAPQEIADFFVPFAHISGNGRTVQVCSQHFAPK
jgi:hypothetical protein